MKSNSNNENHKSRQKMKSGTKFKTNLIENNENLIRNFIRRTNMELHKQMQNRQTV